MDTKGGKRQGGGVLNSVIGIDMYTLMCIKLMTNKNLLYKKINKIKFKNKKNSTQQSNKVIFTNNNLSHCTQILNFHPILFNSRSHV